MGKFFRSPEEFYDLLDKVRNGRKRGACRILVHGSLIKHKGAQHRDIDLYIEYPPDQAKQIGCYGLRDIDFMRVEKGVKSEQPFDVRETNVPFENSDVGGYGEEDRPKRVIFGPQKKRDFWE